MNAKLLITAGVGVVGGLIVTSAALAQGQAVSPKLAPGVKAETGYVADTKHYVVGNPTPIFGDVTFTAKQTGELDRVNEPVDVMADVKNWDWVLVGHDGQGIGYVPMDLLKPAADAKKS